MATRTVNTTLVILILALVSAFFLFYFVLFVPSIESTNCKQSVEVYSELLKYGFRSSEKELILAKETIKCPYETVRASGEERTRKIVADQMASCWNSYGEGKLDLYGQNEGIFCSVCAIITPKQDTSGVVDYLNTHIYLKEKKTYAEYLSGSTFEVSEDVPLRAEEKYGVIYVYTKGARTWDNFVANLQGYGGNSLLIMTGARRLGGVFSPLLVYSGVKGLVTHAIFHENQYDASAQVLLMPYSEDTLVETLGCTSIPVEVLDG